MALRRLNQFTARDGQEEALENFLLARLPVIAAAEGCLGIELLRHAKDDGHFVVVERWRSAADHKAALAATPPQRFEEAKALLSGPPKGESYEELA
ncbi:putative quinol monooxygenase [Radicibacter daui]|uniref:putative quinol monooxygenase n=1 Tax=Radicibacter daui TaxID=3064829 RepID=UPI0040469168